MSLILAAAVVVVAIVTLSGSRVAVASASTMPTHGGWEMDDDYYDSLTGSEQEALWEGIEKLIVEGSVGDDGASVFDNLLFE